MKKKICLLLVLLLGIFLVSCNEEDAKDTAVEDAYNEVVSSLTSDLANVTEDLNFIPTIGKVTITYESSNKEVISDEGKVTRQSTDQTVTIYITLNYNNQEVLKSVSLTVLKIEHTHTVCPTCGKCTATDCTGLDAEKCQGHTTPSLENILKDLYNYTVKYTYTTAEDETYTCLFASTENESEFNFLSEGTNNMYLEYTEDDIFLIVNWGDGWEKYSYYQDEFWDNIESMTIIGLYELDYTNFEYRNGYFYVKEDAVNEVGKEIFGDYDNLDYHVQETFTEVRFKVENDVLVEVTAKSTYVIDGETTEYDYLLEVTKVGTTTITIPEVTEKPVVEVLTIYNALIAEDDEPVVVGGYVGAIYGTSFTLTDGENGILIYDQNAYQANLENIKVGNYLVISGTKTTYKGLQEIKDVTNIKVESQTKTFDPIEISNFLLLDVNCSQVINVPKATITKLPASFNVTADIKITIEDDSNNETSLFMKKNTYGTQYLEFFESLEVGDVIKIEKGLVGCFNTSQIVFSSDTVVSLCATTNISINQTVINVDKNTTFADATSGIVVSLNDETGTRILSSTEYSMTVYPEYDQTREGKYTVTVAYEQLSTTFVINVIGDASFKPTSMETLDARLEKENIAVGIPSTGTPTAIVVPVAFTDYSFSQNQITNLQNAFVGTSSETGWESVSSFYTKSSYGNLSLQFEVTDVYQTNQTSTYYNNRYMSGTDVEYEIIEQVLTSYDTTYDYSKYDYNEDGFIDSIILIYAAPADYENDNLWWAWCYNYENQTKYDGVEPNAYMWASISFMDEEIADYQDILPSKNININTVTYVHETGHLLGLDDYYDYDSNNGPSGGVGGADMMDYNYGDHSSISKILLGWTTPTVVVGGCSITLQRFEETGDVILIPYNWNDSYFAEYILIDYYTPTGLNEMHAGYNGLFSQSGVRIYHIDARVDSTVGKQYDNNYWTMFSFNNSTTSHKFIKLIEADNNNSIEKDNYAANSDLFTASSSFGSNYKWYDNTSFGFTIQITNLTATTVDIVIA